MSIPLAPVSTKPCDHSRFQSCFLPFERNLRLVANHKAPRPLRVMTRPPRNKGNSEDQQEKRWSRKGNQ